MRHVMRSLRHGCKHIVWYTCACCTSHARAHRCEPLMVFIKTLSMIDTVAVGSSHTNAQRQNHVRTMRPRSPVQLRTILAQDAKPTGHVRQRSRRRRRRTALAKGHRLAHPPRFEGRGRLLGVLLWRQVRQHPSRPDTACRALASEHER